MNTITKNTNGQYILTTENGSIYPCTRWYEKKSGHWHIKLPSDNPTGRIYIREKLFVDGKYEFEDKTEHRTGMSTGGWKSRLTEEEKTKLEEYENGIEKLKQIALSRPVVKVDPNSEEGILLQMEKLKEKLAKMKSQKNQ